MRSSSDSSCLRWTPLCFAHTILATPTKRQRYDSPTATAIQWAEESRGGPRDRRRSGPTGMYTYTTNITRSNYTRTSTTMSTERSTTTRRSSASMDARIGIAMNYGCSRCDSGSDSGNGRNRGSDRDSRSRIFHTKCSGFYQSDPQQMTVPVGVPVNVALGLRNCPGCISFLTRSSYESGYGYACGMLQQQKFHQTWPWTRITTTFTNTTTATTKITHTQFTHATMIAVPAALTNVQPTSSLLCFSQMLQNGFASLKNIAQDLMAALAADPTLAFSLIVWSSMSCVLLRFVITAVWLVMVKFRQTKRSDKNTSTSQNIHRLEKQLHHHPQAHFTDTTHATSIYSHDDVLLIKESSGSSNGIRTYYYNKHDPLHILRLKTHKDHRNMFQKLKDSILHALFPDGFFDPSRSYSVVKDGYMRYVTFQAAIHALNYAALVLSTQQLLRAVGVDGGGGSGAVPLVGFAASISWILKDGLGRIGAILLAALMGSRYDADPKRWKFRGDLIYALGIGIELTVFLFPAQFLLIGTLANVVKSASYMMRLPTAAAILKTFAVKENFGDLSGKGNAQEVFSGTIGTFFGILLSFNIRDNGPALLVFYVTYLAIYAVLCRVCVKNVTLPTLNLQRTFALANSYWNLLYSAENTDKTANTTTATTSSVPGARSFAPNPAPPSISAWAQAPTAEELVLQYPPSSDTYTLSIDYINRHENILTPSSLGSTRNVHFARPITQLIHNLDEYRTLKALYSADRNYFLTARNGKVLIALNGNALAKDKIMAVLQAAYILRAISTPSKDSLKEDQQLLQQRQQQHELDLEQLLRTSLDCAAHHIDSFLHVLKIEGWNVNIFLYASRKRYRYWTLTEDQQSNTHPVPSV